MAADFLDVEFPRSVAQGTRGFIERRTNIAALASGFEERNSRWYHSRRSWNAGLGIRSADDLAAVADLFEDARGMLSGFRFRDWTDYKSCKPSGAPAPSDQNIGTGDGVTVSFRLRKRYGTLRPYWRPITKPERGTVRVARGGVEAGAGWSVDHLSGVVTFTTPPAAGVPITAGFRFFVPVRFNSDVIGHDLNYFRDDITGSGAVPDVSLVEVRDDLDT